MCQKCKERAEFVEKNGIKLYEYGDTFSIFDDVGELLSVILDEEDLVSFSNYILIQKAHFDNHVRKANELQVELREAIYKMIDLARERAIVDSIVQHCLTGK